MSSSIEFEERRSIQDALDRAARYQRKHRKIEHKPKVKPPNRKRHRELRRPRPEYAERVITVESRLSTGRIVMVNRVDRRTSVRRDGATIIS